MSKRRKRRSRKERGRRERVGSQAPAVGPDVGAPEPQAAALEPEVSASEPQAAASEAEVAEPEPVASVADLAEPESGEPMSRATGAAPMAGPPPSRRRFFREAWLTLSGLVVFEYVWVVINFLRPRPSAAEAAGIVVAGPVERFEGDTVTAFQRGKFYLSRLEDGGFLALSRVCTHLGCTVPWNDEEGRFVCPCHSSVYNRKGEVVKPPAPRPLDLFPIRIENGILSVDTSQPLRRTAFEDSQVTLP